MKRSPLLLTVSVGVNLALGYAWWTGRSDPSAGYAPTASSPAVLAAQNVATSRPHPGSLAALVDGETVRDVSDLIVRLSSGDLVAAAAELRAAGLSEDSVKFLAEAALVRRMREKTKDVWQQEEETPYWLPANARGQSKPQQALQALWRETHEIARALGLDQTAYTFGRAKLPFSAEKEALVDRIETDFQELTQEVWRAADGVTLPSDTEKFRYLEEEHRKDLAAVLTPEELDAWEVRRSQTAQQMRWNLGAFAPTEEEFKQLVRLQDGFDREWRHADMSGAAPDDWDRRRAAEKALQDQIVSALGEERYAEYRLGTNHEYRQLASLERRLQLAPGTARSVFNLRAEISDKSKRIAEDTQLSYEQKDAALKALAERTRATVETQLGAEGSAYYQRTNGHWLKELGNNGHYVTFDAASGSVSFVTLPRPPKKAPPKS